MRPLLLTLLLVMGCDVTRFAANTTGSVFVRASPALDAYWDVDVAGAALPGSIIQLEGLLRVSPEHEGMLLNLIRAYVSYAYGWLEDESERLSSVGDEDAAAVQRERAMLCYRRGAELAKYYAASRLSGFDDAYGEGIDAFREWLEDLDDDDDAIDLWWIGYAWGQSINAEHPREAHPDRAFAIAMVRRSVAIDPSVYGGSGSAFLAFVATQAPGSTLESAERAWNTALAGSERKNLLIQVVMARLYAVRRGDRELYVSLLREVLEAGDGDPALRLSNQLARRRAARYLREVDSLFSSPQ